jgi:DNA-binding HxlR family transcriptional regulator
VKVPRPGAPVRGSRTGRPIMALLDLLGRRWALRVMWELRGEPLTFRALRERCDDVSPSVLNERLAELREAGIVGAGPGGYALTAEGAKLGRKIGALEAWAAEWQKRTERG